jgi:hypothetical protein
MLPLSYYRRSRLRYPNDYSSVNSISGNHFKYVLRIHIGELLENSCIDINEVSET